MANNASAGPDGNSLFLTASPSRADEIFLEEPRSRIREFITLVRVMRDFVRGFRVLHFVGPCVTVFGSARIKSDSPYYELARKMGAAARAKPRRCGPRAGISGKSGSIRLTGRSRERGAQSERGLRSYWGVAPWCLGFFSQRFLQDHVSEAGSPAAS
jgi:hypothetical protein